MNEFSYSQSTNWDYILWKNDVKLMWGNYKNIPETNTDIAAVSICGFRFDVVRVKNDSLQITSEAFFIPSKSWVKEDKRVERLLIHEQGHFDITEVYARKFRNKINELICKSKVIDSHTLKEAIKQLYKSTHNELNIESDLYDEETRLGSNYEIQDRWTIKIANELDGMKKYANNKITIKMPR